jgi:ribosomal protein S27AE
MDIQAAYRAPSATDFSPPNCPFCGATVLMAEKSAFNPCGRIRHTWSCDDCGEIFETSIRVFPRLASTKVRH